jgi:phospholipid/cholesterol/gamma-HCH transport system permease protein
LLAGAIFAQIFFQSNIPTFFYGITHPFFPRDFWVSFVKSIFFAFWIASAGSYFGFQVSGGAKQVGRASTNAVVISTVVILILDFTAAILFF